VDETVDEDEGRALLRAYLPGDEPAATSLADVVARARTVRRRRRAVLASAGSVVVVIAATVGAVALTGGAGGPAPPPAPAASRPVAPSTPPASRAPGTPPASPAPAAAPCDQVNRSNDPGARGWANWVRTKLGPKAKAGPVEWLRMCELDVGYTVYPPHTQNHAEFVLPVLRKPGDAPATDNVTAVTDRFDRLPDKYRTPCGNDLITEIVVCHQRKLADGSLLVQRDFYDILIYGDPKDPAAKRDKQAVRDATRIFPDGRTVSIGLVYNLQPKWKASFDRHALSLDQLAAIVTDPGALRYFPHP
jgi:hypothetical protein